MLISNELLTPKTDVVFHCLFRQGNESITKSFIEAILKQKIKKIDLDKDKILVREFEKEKLGTVDLKVTLNDDTICHIEMQMFDRGNIEKRGLFYWSRIYGSQLVESEDYDKLKKTISILILDYELKKYKDEKYITKWQIYESENRKKVLTESFEFYIIQIPRGVKEEINDELVKWLKFLDNPNSTEVREMAEKDENIKKAMNRLEEISNDAHMRRIAELREKAIRDEISAINYATNQGEERGKKQEKIEIAKNMLNEGIEMSVIEKVTGLAKEEIEKIKE